MPAVAVAAWGAVGLELVLERAVKVVERQRGVARVYVGAHNPWT